MTREQVETEMAQYRTIFTVVRLLDAAQVGGEESVNSFCSCYSYWGKNAPCRNCISRQVLEDHRQRTKLEYMGSEVFQGHRRLPRGRRRSLCHGADPEAGRRDPH